MTDPRLLFEPIFLLPFVNGLVLALVLPPLGAYARLRDEWLASLGLAQAAAAGLVLGAALVEPVVVLALLAAALAAALKGILGRAGNDAYAVMILLGWAVALVGAANLAHGEELTRVLAQGQLYFTSASHLGGIAAVAVAAGALLPWIGPRLLRARFFPSLDRANGVTRPRHEIAFNLLLASALAVASSTIGVMAAFALVFLPPWLAFRVGHGWPRTLAWSAGVALVCYLASFVAAIVLDQPFGPVLVLALVAASAGRALVRP